MNKLKNNKSCLYVAMLTVFIDLVGFGIIIPIQPFLAMSFGAKAYIITLLGGTYSLMQFIFAPFWGRLSDKIGRRPIMMVSIFTSFLGFLLIGLSQNLLMLFIARAIAGFGSANIGTAQAIVADITDEKGRARGMGLIGASLGMGFIVGPAIGGFAGQYSLSLPGLIAAGLSIINLLYTFFCLPETNPFLTKKNDRIKIAKNTYFPLKDIININQPLIKYLLLIFFILSFAFSLFEQSIGLFIQSIWVPNAQDLLGSGPKASLFIMKDSVLLTTYFLLLVGFSGAFVQGFLISVLNKRFKEPILIIAGLAILSFALFLVIPLGMLGIYSIFLLDAFFIAAGMGILQPSLSGLLSKSVKNNEVGNYLGISQSLSSLGRVFGPMISGTLFYIDHKIPFMCSAIILCGAIYIAVLAYNKAHPLLAIKST